MTLDQDSHFPRTTQVGHDGSDAVVYDDVQGAVAGAKLHPTATPAWILHDYGISGGVEFYALAVDLNDSLYMTVQTSHGQALSSILDQHIHYTLPSDSEGDRFRFQLDVIGAGIRVAGEGGAWAAPAGSPFTAEHVMDDAENGHHRLFDLANVPALNTTVSSIYKIKLTRIAATADEYAGAVYLEFLDGHAPFDTIGSLAENSKT